MSEREWLDGLKEGCTVCIRGFRREYRMATVTYTTTTRVDVGTLRFQRRSGKLISASGRFYSEYLAEPTPEIVADIEVNELRRAMERIVWRDVPVDTLKATHAAYTASEVERLAQYVNDREAVREKTK